MKTEDCAGRAVSEVKLPLAVTDIHQLLPHRYPFLLLDRVIEYVPDQTIVGLKNVTANEPFFQGHFPNRPVMPGVLILEALAQLGALYAKLRYPDRVKEKLMVFSGADKVRFRRQVLPGDVLRLELSNCVRKMVHWRMEAKATVDGDVAAEGIVMAAEV